MKIIISGGGTGGHIFPAIAIANALRKAQPNCDILFVGAEGRMEMEKVPQAGYPIEGLWISGLQRRFTTQNLLFPIKVLVSLWKSVQIIRRFQPDVAVGVGGYASGPLLQAATMMGIPALIQEQNSHPGMTNRLLAKRVQKICVVFDNLDAYFPPEKIVLTGNPVRQNIAQLQGTRAEAMQYFGLDTNKKTLFVTGGSLGARGINQGILAHIDALKANNIQVLWQTGKLYETEICEQLKTDTTHFFPMAFIDRMDLAYLAADAIVSRAGGTIAELCLVGKPAILMPSPNVTDDHQTANAMNLVSKNAALLVRDHEAQAQLMTAIQQVLFDDQLRQTLSANIKQLAISDAADRIAREVVALVR